MSIDKQRIAAVAALEALGFEYTSDRGWLPPINSARGAIGRTLPDFTAEADAMHALLVIRADVLMGAPEASDDSESADRNYVIPASLQKPTKQLLEAARRDGATELQLISDAVEAYEIKRWPRGKIPGGKG
jgi:hypothetical protein